VKGAYPAYSPAQTQSFLEGRAVEMGATGKDTVFGWGRLNLGAPPAATNKKVCLPYILKPSSD
jgi:hypothetical protein